MDENVGLAESFEKNVTRLVYLNPYSLCICLARSGAMVSCVFVARGGATWSSWKLSQADTVEWIVECAGA